MNFKIEPESGLVFPINVPGPGLVLVVVTSNERVDAHVVDEAGRGAYEEGDEQFPTLATSLDRRSHRMTVPSTQPATWYVVVDNSRGLAEGVLVVRLEPPAQLGPTGPGDFGPTGGWGGPTGPALGWVGSHAYADPRLAYGDPRVPYGKPRDPGDDAFLEPFERINAKSEELRQRMLALPEGNPERERLGKERIALAEELAGLVKQDPAAFFAVLGREMDRKKPPSE